MKERIRPAKDQPGEPWTDLLLSDRLGEPVGAFDTFPPTRLPPDLDSSVDPGPLAAYMLVNAVAWKLDASAIGPLLDQVRVRAPENAYYAIALLSHAVETEDLTLQAEAVEAGAQAPSYDSGFTASFDRILTRFEQAPRLLPEDENVPSYLRGGTPAFDLAIAGLPHLCPLLTHFKSPEPGLAEACGRLGSTMHRDSRTLIEAMVGNALQRAATSASTGADEHELERRRLSWTHSRTLNAVHALEDSPEPRARRYVETFRREGEREAMRLLMIDLGAPLEPPPAWDVREQ